MENSSSFLIASKRKKVARSHRCDHSRMLIITLLSQGPMIFFTLHYFVYLKLFFIFLYFFITVQPLIILLKIMCICMLQANNDSSKVTVITVTNTLPRTLLLLRWVIFHDRFYVRDPNHAFWYPVHRLFIHFDI